ncbi:hypothetical protein [Helicobacter sp. MIT 14-3879]|uniref:hypothetical protein n=1 Tax=Helicobacter sp. MIT 14-3879 TaxID=2040649 RepID=UPI000E1F439D|nr:hypothetical protein [Helicobacter sp. MIT 14-3879]RDU65647.1 hypothetical protein CQA44_01310 [Helicobacter sp. MIT 14-3879]
MMIDVYRMCEFIKIIEVNHKKAFWEVILDSINPLDLSYSGFSEFETYGNFMYMKYPNEIAIISRKRDRFAKKLIGDKFLSDEILSWYARDYEVIGIESWDKTSYFLNKLIQIKIFRYIRPKYYKFLLKCLDKISIKIRF